MCTLSLPAVGPHVQGEGRHGGRPGCSLLCSCALAGSVFSIIHPNFKNRKIGEVVHSHHRRPTGSLGIFSPSQLPQCPDNGLVVQCLSPAGCFGSARIPSPVFRMIESPSAFLGIPSTHKAVVLPKGLHTFVCSCSNAVG